MKYLRFSSFLIVALLAVSLSSPQKMYAQMYTPSVTLSPSTTPGQMDAAFETKAANLRVMLRSFMVEHTMLAAGMADAILTQESPSKFEDLMNTNETNLANQIQTIYGKTARDAFVTLWSDHMNEYKNYTTALMKHDTKGINTAKQHLQTVATNMGKLFTNSGSNASSTVTNMMTDHINGTLAYINADAKNDSITLASLSKSNFDQSQDFADVLAQIVLTDKPQLFR